MYISLSPFPCSALSRATGWRLKVEESKPTKLFFQFMTLNENIWISCDMEAIFIYKWRTCRPTHQKTSSFPSAPPASPLMSFKQLKTLFDVPLCFVYINWGGQIHHVWLFVSPPSPLFLEKAETLQMGVWGNGSESWQNSHRYRLPFSPASLRCPFIH